MAKTVKVKMKDHAFVPISDTERLFFKNGETYPDVDKDIAELLEKGGFADLPDKKGK